MIFTAANAMPPSRTTPATMSAISLPRPRPPPVAGGPPSPGDLGGPSLKVWVGGGMGSVPGAW